MKGLVPESEYEEKIHGKVHKPCSAVQEHARTHTHTQAYYQSPGHPDPKVNNRVKFSVTEQ